MNNCRATSATRLPARGCCEGVRAVVHCAAVLPLRAAEEIFEIDVDGTRKVLAAATAAGGGRVVQISSTAVYGIPNPHPLHEDDPLRGAYGKAKIRAEAIPAWPASWMLRVLEQQRLSPLCDWICGTAATESRVDIGRIAARLNFTPANSNEDTLVRNCDWCHINRDHLVGRQGLTHRTPRKKGVLNLAKLFV